MAVSNRLRAWDREVLGSADSACDQHGNASMAARNRGALRLAIREVRTYSGEVQPLRIIDRASLPREHHRHADFARSRICITTVCGALLAGSTEASGHVMLSNCGSKASEMKRVRAA